MGLLSPRGDKTASEDLQREEPSKPTRSVRSTVNINAVGRYLADYLKRPDKVCQGGHLPGRRGRPVGVAEQADADTVFVIIRMPSAANVITVKLLFPKVRGADYPVA